MDEYIHDLLLLLESPSNYFKGLGEFSFPIPSEIILFFRNRFGKELNIRNNEIHYRYVLIVNLGDPVKVLVDGEAMELISNSFLLILPYQYHRYFNNFQKKISLFFLTFELEESIFLEQFRNMVFHYNTKHNQPLKTLIEYYQNKKSMILSYYTGYFLSNIFSESDPYILRGQKKKARRL